MTRVSSRGMERFWTDGSQCRSSDERRRDKRERTTLRKLLVLAGRWTDPSGPRNEKHPSRCLGRLGCYQRRSPVLRQMCGVSGRGAFLRSAALLSNLSHLNVALFDLGRQFTLAGQNRKGAASQRPLAGYNLVRDEMPAPTRTTVAVSKCRVNPVKYRSSRCPNARVPSSKS